MKALVELQQRYPRVMGLVLGIAMHPLLSVLLTGR